MPPLGYRSYEKAPPEISELDRRMFEASVRMEAILTELGDLASSSMRKRDFFKVPKVETPKVYYPDTSIEPGQRVAAWLAETPVNGRFRNNLYTQIVEVKEDGSHEDVSEPELRASSSFFGRLELEGVDLDELTPLARLDFIKDLAETVDLIQVATQEITRPQVGIESSTDTTQP